MVEALNIYKAFDQSMRDCQPGNIPLVAHRKNRTPWHVTLLASDLIKLSQLIAGFIKDDGSGTDQDR